MKILFGVKVTETDNPRLGDEIDFITAEIDESLKNQIDKYDEMMIGLQKKVKLPLGLYIAKFLTLLLWVSVIIGVLKGLANHMTISQIYQNIPYLFYISPVAFVVWIGLEIFTLYKKIKIQKSEEVDDLQDFVDQVLRESMIQLDIPEESKEVNVLAFRYSIQNNKMKVLKTGMTQYIHFVKFMFIRDDQLCMADLYRVFSIPLSEIIDIIPIDKKIGLHNWNKSVPANHESYKKYKIRFNQYRMFFIKRYYSVKIRHNSDEYEFYIPNYELDTFLELTNRT
ncbi:MAG: hypothetical protein KKE16_04160 [Firmicutes bacterium]|nr:hypothetical protein [Bacillota bacterium]